MSPPRGPPTRADAAVERSCGPRLHSPASGGRCVGRTTSLGLARTSVGPTSPSTTACGGHRRRDRRRHCDPGRPCGGTARGQLVRRRLGRCDDPVPVGDVPPVRLRLAGARVPGLLHVRLLVGLEAQQDRRVAVGRGLGRRLSDGARVGRRHADGQGVGLGERRVREAELRDHDVVHVADVRLRRLGRGGRCLGARGELRGGGVLRPFACLGLRDALVDAPGRARRMPRRRPCSAARPGRSRRSRAPGRRSCSRSCVHLDGLCVGGRALGARDRLCRVAGAPAAASSVVRIAVWLIAGRPSRSRSASATFSWMSPSRTPAVIDVDVRRADLDGLRGGLGALRARDDLDDVRRLVPGALSLGEARDRRRGRSRRVRLRDVGRVLRGSGVGRRGSGGAGQARRATGVGLGRRQRVATPRPGSTPSCTSTPGRS